MRIRKDPQTRNEYVRAGGLWIRNFTKYGVQPIDINRLVHQQDYAGMLHNENSNRTYNLRNIADEKFHFSKIVILSDGYQFEERHLVLENLPEDVAILAVNGALAKWNLIRKRAINFYLINSPYEGNLNLLPKHNYFPACIASTRTEPGFLTRYRGNLFLYEPTPEREFGCHRRVGYTIDDYRNSVCAAVGLAYRFGVKKLLLYCCDQALPQSRPATVQLPNGLWTYPQHLQSQKIIDANLYWLSQLEQPVQMANYSSGPEYENAEYIAQETVTDFFADEQL